MWSLGKVIKSPEVLRVYLGSFWDEPLMFDDNAQLFEMEEKDLMKDLKDLPRNSAVRKINELVKRIRIAKVHAYIISYLKDQMPMLMGGAKKQAKVRSVYRDIAVCFYGIFGYVCAKSIYLHIRIMCGLVDRGDVSGVPVCDEEAQLSSR